MNSDLVQMGALALALDNIAKIFKQTKETIIPEMEKRIDEISKEYSNDFNQIPDEKIAIIYNASKILKYFTERRVLKTDFSITDIETVRLYSNDITQNYQKIKNFNPNAA